MFRRSPPKSRTSLWREKAKRLKVCNCEHHQEAFTECDCEYHTSNNAACQCKYHSSPNGAVPECPCEYHSAVHQCLPDSTSSNSESSQHSMLQATDYIHHDNITSSSKVSPTRSSSHASDSSPSCKFNVASSIFSGFEGDSDEHMNEKQHQIHVNGGGTSGMNLQHCGSSSPDNSPSSLHSYISEDDGDYEHDHLSSCAFQVHALRENPGGDSSDSVRDDSVHSGSEDGEHPDCEDNFHHEDSSSNSEDGNGRGPTPPPSPDPDADPDADPDVDPDADPDDPDGEENRSSDSDSDPDADMQEGAQNFSLENERLDLVLDTAAGRTTREVMAMVMALALRSSLDYETLIKMFNILHVSLAHSNLPTTKDQLWSRLNRNAAGIRKNVYCSKCVKLLGPLEQLPNPVLCECGWTKPKKKVKYFITLNVRNQLESILKQPGMWERFQYPQNRQKRSAEAIEDILDGEAYKSLRQAEGLTPYDFTYIFNMDGLKIFKSAKTEAWPIFIRINELPPNLRQKNVILAGVWLDQEHVDFNLFMTTFVKQANKLSSTGVTWAPDGVNQQVSRFFPTCCSADAKARAGILCMAQHSGWYGCTFCEHEGIKLEGSMKYPIPGTIVNRVRVQQGVEYIEEVLIQPAPLRTDQSIKNLMLQVAEDPRMRRIRGVIGPAQVMLMSSFDLGIGFSTDDLHPIFLGVARFHSELLLEGIENVYRVGKNDRAIITRRLLKSLTPTHISRKPRSIDLMAMWKGSEWRNWLLFYAIPCLQGIVPERYLRVFALLSKAIFLLSRDVIEEEDLVEAARCIEQYVHQFQDVYGPQNMRFNVHILTHLVQCVRSWGPLFSHGTMPFESWNHRIGKTVTSPKGAIDQVVMRYLMHTLVDNIPQNPEISEEVKEIIEQKILKSKFKDVRDVDGAYFFGKSTERNVTEREAQLLTDAGYELQNVTEYCQVKVNGLECRSVHYRGELQSNNTFVYTFDDDFGIVESIVVLEEENPVGGVFVRLYGTGNPVLDVSHIVPVLNDDDGLSFFRISDIRNLAIKMYVLDQWYISPMPNQHEID